MTAPTVAGPAAALRVMLGLVEARLDVVLNAERRRWARVDARARVPVDAVATLVSAGGKRLRPTFCLSGYLACGGDPDGRVAVDVAAGLELLHAYLLIHDDVLDDSPLRRGAPTAHELAIREHRVEGWAGEARRFGEGVATLAGDLAHGYADALVAGASPQVRAIWDELRSEVVVGQYLDIRLAAERVARPELSRWVALCKSGRYTIHRPLELGACLAGRAGAAHAFGVYGEALGEAFQLRDDLLDTFGDSGVSGKPTGSDAAQHKMTFLLALALQQHPDLPQLLDAAGAPVAEVLDDLGIRGRVEARIDHLVDRARTAVTTADLEPGWADELADLALTVAYRDH